MKTDGSPRGHFFYGIEEERPRVCGHTRSQEDLQTARKKRKAGQNAKRAEKRGPLNQGGGAFCDKICKSFTSKSPNSTF
jgi:hypothetical protein